MGMLLQPKPQLCCDLVYIRVQCCCPASPSVQIYRKCFLWPLRRSLLGGSSASLPKVHQLFLVATFTIYLSQWLLLVPNLVQIYLASLAADLLATCLPLRVANSCHAVVAAQFKVVAAQFTLRQVSQIQGWSVNQKSQYFHTWCK